MCSETLGRPVATIPVTLDLHDAIAFQQRSKFLHHSIRAEGWTLLADDIENTPTIFVTMSNSQREAIVGTARRIAECDVVGSVVGRQLIAAGSHRGLHHLARDKAFYIDAELRQIFSAARRMVPLQRALYNPLGQCWIEIPARTLGHQDQRIPLRPIVPSINIPYLTLASVGRRDDDQRPV